MNTVTESAPWETLARPTPAWFRRARLGIFIHWGPYSVPAWAEPIGALGTIPDRHWYAHNPYAEWYLNTIRIPGSPAAAHHQQMHGGAPYDDFLDQWRAEDFEPTDWAELFASAGADYVVPTTKHHDGIALWDAPGTGARNTVHRGPRRDLIAEIGEAVRSRGMRLGLYYSGGLDWGVTDLHPHRSDQDLLDIRPRDAAYNVYAYLHVRDLIDRFRPDVLWNDIEWPDSGKRTGSHSLYELLEHYYAVNEDGVINNRWGIPHCDYRCSEYAHAPDPSQADKPWEHTRGMGYSFAHNQVEGPDHVMSAVELVRHFIDVVARDGRLLLNMGPTASGIIPDLHRRTLEDFARWYTPALREAAAAVTGPVETAVPGLAGFWRTPGYDVAFIEPGGPGVPLRALPGVPGASEVEDLAGAAAVEIEDGVLAVRARESAGLPVAVRIRAQASGSAR